MKDLKLTFNQNETTFEETIKINNADSLSKVLGTAIMRLFDLNTVLRSSSNNYFKATEIVNFKIETDGYLIDTNEINESLRTKFKFGQNAASKRAFAQRVWAVVDFFISEPETYSIEQIESELKDL